MKHRNTLNQSGFTLIEIIATIVIVSIFCAMMLTLLSDSFIKSSDSVRRLSKSSDLSKVMANMMMDYAPYPRWKAETDYVTWNKVLPQSMNGRFYICTNSGKTGTSEPQWRDYGETQDGGARWKAGVWVKQTTYAVGDMVIPTNPNGHFYRCITAVAGTSGATEPTAWPPTGYATISDGSVTWKRLLGYIYEEVLKPDTPAAPNLNSKKNSRYGQYYVVENRFVKFVSNAIQPIDAGEPENVLEVKIKNDEDETLTTLFAAKEN